MYGWILMNDLFWYKIKLREAVNSTGMENGWNDEKCKEVFDELMAKYLDKRAGTNAIR
jgi:hypothetical protein